MSAAPYSDVGYTSSMTYICIQTKGNDKGRSSCHIAPSRLLSGAWPSCSPLDQPNLTQIGQFSRTFY